MLLLSVCITSVKSFKIMVINLCVPTMVWNSNQHHNLCIIGMMARKKRFHKTAKKYFYIFFKIFSKHEAFKRNERDNERFGLLPSNTNHSIVRPSYIWSCLHIHSHPLLRERPLHTTHETAKKAVMFHTHCNFFSQLQWFSQHFLYEQRFSHQLF